MVSCAELGFTVEKLSDLGMKYSNQKDRWLAQAKAVLHDRFNLLKEMVSGFLGLRSMNLVNQRPGAMQAPNIQGKAGSLSCLPDVGVALCTHGTDGVIGVGVFNLVKKTKRDRHHWALEVCAAPRILSRACVCAVAHA